VYLLAGRASRRYLLCMFAGLILSGCSLLKPEERQELPVPLEINLGATENVNPNVKGRPSPVAVKVFELAADTKFMAADYFQLMDQGAEALGDESLSAEEFMLLPGETRIVRKRADLKSRFLGVVAGYSDPAGSNWRAIVALPAPYLAGRLWTASVSPTKKLWVSLGKSSVTIFEEQPR